MRSFVCITILLILALAGAAAGDKPASSNQYVKFSSELKKKTFKPGESGVLLVSLKPVKGIHINLKPAMSVRFDTLSQVRPNGVMDIPKKGEYLDTKERIKIPVIIPASSAPGSASLKAEFTYYYCSDAEGWCSRYRQPIEMTITVTK